MGPYEIVVSEKPLAIFILFSLLFCIDRDRWKIATWQDQVSDGWWTYHKEHDKCLQRCDPGHGTRRQIAQLMSLIVRLKDSNT